MFLALAQMHPVFLEFNTVPIILEIAINDKLHRFVINLHMIVTVICAIAASVALLSYLFYLEFTENRPVQNRWDK